jgi:putative (di)nucleoside polyphosphate hydrolase
MSAALPYRRGVGIMLLDRRNFVFAGQRIDTPGAWQMPQGGIDAGETPREAALRELAEETGTAKAEFLAETAGWLRYDLPAHLHGKVWGGAYRGQEQKWFAMRFLGSDSDFNLATEHREFDTWRWLAPADLPRLIVPFKRALYEDVLREFATLLGEVRPGSRPSA